MTKQEVYCLLRIRARMAEIQVIAEGLSDEHIVFQADLDLVNAKVRAAYLQGCIDNGGAAGNHWFGLHSVDVLSEPDFPVGSSELKNVVYLVDEGPCSGQHVSSFDIEIPSWLAAVGLMTQGSDPSFFNLTADGAMVDLEDDRERSIEEHPVVGDARALWAAAQRVVDAADDTGCTDDRTVTSAGAVEALRSALSAEPVPPGVKERLEYLRGELNAERISWDEIHELQSLAKFIEPDDVLLLEAAGVAEEAYLARSKAAEGKAVTLNGSAVARQARVQAMVKKLYPFDASGAGAELRAAMPPAYPHWNPESHWPRHPDHPVETWQREVEEDATRQSYVEWVNDRIQCALELPAAYRMQLQEKEVPGAEA